MLNRRTGGSWEAVSLSCLHQRAQTHPQNAAAAPGSFYRVGFGASLPEGLRCTADLSKVPVLEVCDPEQVTWPAELSVNAHRIGWQSSHGVGGKAMRTRGTG